MWRWGLNNRVSFCGVLRSLQSGGFAFGLFLACVSASAQASEKTLETFSGADVTSNSIFGYFGLGWSFGRDVREAGFRVKLLSGRGRYTYKTTLPGFSTQSTLNGDVSLFQALGGYQWRRGPTTVKAYGGLAWEEHDLSVRDPENPVSGSKAGAMGQLEVWRNLGSHVFVSVDASYATVFDSYFVQGRLGRKVSDRFSMGAEAAALGHQAYDGGRGGGFLRIHLDRMDVTLSGGLSGSYLENDFSGYGAFGIYSRF